MVGTRRRAGGGVVGLGVGRGGDGDGAGGDLTGGVVGEGDGVVGAAVAVDHRAGRRQGLGGADVRGVEGLGDRPVSSGEGAGGDGRDSRRSGGGVVGLGVGRRGDGDGAGGDLAGGVVDEGDRVVGAAVAVVDGPAGVSVLPVPTLVPKVWVNADVFPFTRAGTIVGTPLDEVVPSYVFVSVTAVTVIASLFTVRAPSPEALSVAETVFVAVTVKGVAVPANVVFVVMMVEGRALGEVGGQKHQGAHKKRTRRSRGQRSNGQSRAERRASGCPTYRDGESDAAAGAVSHCAALGSYGDRHAGEVDRQVCIAAKPGTARVGRGRRGRRRGKTTIRRGEI